MGAEKRDGPEPTRGTIDEATAVVRDMYGSHPQTVVVGGGVAVVVALGVVAYAVSVSPLGAALAALAWLAFVGGLVWRGWGRAAVARAVLGAPLFVLAIPTIVRLVTETPPVAGRQYDMEALPVFASVVVLLLLAAFSTWAISTAGSAGRRT